MLSPQMRPRFEMRVPHASSETLQRLKEHLAAPDCACTGEMAGNHFYLKISRKLRRIWSPQLNLEVIGQDSGSTIHGHFGPRSDIWTLFMALYAISAFVFFMGLLFAMSQWMLDMQPWALWPVAGSVVLAIIVYLLALAGQALSQDQMAMLLHFVEDAEDVKGTPVH